ncbi:MAG TPA: histidine kinase, partial [Helicobacter sp.]|nr:histidine kinase [Helicobacter sp.]
EECKNIIQPDLIKHKITLEIITPTQSLSLYCYKNELKQALLNLLSNS